MDREYCLFLLCALGIVLSVAFVPYRWYSVASSLYAALPIALMIVNFDGTFILSSPQYT